MAHAPTSTFQPGTQARCQGRRRALLELAAILVFGACAAALVCELITIASLLLGRPLPC